MRAPHRPRSSFPFRFSPLVAAFAGLLPLLASGQAAPTSPFVVVNTNDSGTGTLRQAILDANATASPGPCPTGSRIDFAIPGTGPFTISPSLPLPDIRCEGLAIVGTGDVVIDGTSVSVVYGGNIGASGLSAVVPMKISKLEVANFRTSGAHIGIAGPVVVEGSRIHNNQIGIQIMGRISPDGLSIDTTTGGTVGGPTDAERNYIYGNGTGVVVGTTATIMGNYIGTPDGTTASKNFIGVNLAARPSTVTKNLISGNNDFETAVGIRVADSGGSIISENFIGTDATGLNPLPNHIGIDVHTDVSITGNTISHNRRGVVVNQFTSATSITLGTMTNNTEAIVFDGVSGGTVSGVTLGAGSRTTAGDYGISVYCSSGVEIKGNSIANFDIANVALFGATDIRISSNTITNASASSPLGAFGYGIHASADPCTVPVLAASAAKRLAKAAGTENSFFEKNTITGNRDGIRIDGSTNVMAGNTIFGNRHSGVVIVSGVHNLIAQNSIFDNAVKNIDLVDPLNPDVPLANDPGDPDTGPNNGQNHPDVTSVVRFPTHTEITYTFNSAPGDYTIQVFANPADGKPAGKTFVDGFTVTLDAITGPQITGKRIIGGPELDFISLTATRNVGLEGTDTSEFSEIEPAVLAPAVAISPSAVNFGDVTTDLTATQTITFTSSGGLPWVLSAFVSDNCVTRTAMCSGSPFICSNNTCAPGTYSASASCSITATFAPQVAGPASTTIFVCDNTGGKQITLSGNGLLPPPLTISPASLDFGAVLLGTQSPAQTFTILNPAKTGVTLSAPTVTGDFTLAGTTCAETLASMASCTADVSFGPTLAGARNGALQVAFGSGGNAVASLTGTGAAALQLDAPASIDFGSHTVGLDPVVRTATLRNTGTSTVTISAITATGPFALANGCPAALVAGASCSLTLTFSSTTVGNATGNVSIASNAAGGLQIIALSGLVAPAPIHIEPDRFDFGSVVVGRQSTSQRFVIANAGQSEVPLGAVATTGNFAIVSSNCAATLAPFSGCAAEVRFAPTQPGAVSGTLFVPFGTGAKVRIAARGSKAIPGITASASLSGTGTNLAQIETPALIEFGALTLGAAPIVRTATVTNTGNAVVTISSITISGPFTLSHDCPLNFHPGTSCTLTITFNSTTLGAAAGAVSIASSAVGGLRMIALGGLVQARPTPVITVNPLSMSFGNRLIGTQSPAVRITIANDGGAPAALGAMSTSLDYLVVTTSCAATLAPQESCFADIAMRPVGFGNRVGEFFFTSDAEGSPHRVAISGAGCRPFSTGNNRAGGNANCSP